MTPAPETPGGDADPEATRQTDAMRAKLRQDVETWKARGAEPSEFIGQQPAPRAVKRARKAVPAEPRQQPDPRSTPFRMSYDGGTSAEYIQYMIDRGAR